MRPRASRPSGGPIDVENSFSYSFSILSGTSSGDKPSSSILSVFIQIGPIKFPCIGLISSMCANRISWHAGVSRTSDPKIICCFMSDFVDAYIHILTVQMELAPISKVGHASIKHAVRCRARGRPHAPYFMALHPTGATYVDAILERSCPKPPRSSYL